MSDLATTALGAYLPPDSGRSARDIEEALAAAIAAGDLAPGDRLPSERELSDRLGVSRVTLRRALEALLQAGLVHKRVGRGGGTFVAEPVVEHQPGRGIGYWRSLRAQGLRAGTSVLQARVKPAGAIVAPLLDLELGDPVYEVRRVRFTGGKPLSIELTQFSAQRFPGLLEAPLGGSLCDLVTEMFGVAPVRTVERLAPALATADEAEILGTSPGAPLMRIERVVYLADDVPMAYDIDLFRGDRTRVLVTSDGSGLAERGAEPQHGGEELVLLGHVPADGAGKRSGSGVAA